MTKLDKDRRIVAQQVKRFEQAARDIRDLADKLHKKMEALHLEVIAARERARAARVREGQTNKPGAASAKAPGRIPTMARKMRRPEKHGE